MRIFALDDEKIALEVLVDAVTEAVPDAEVVSFRKSKDAIDFLKDNTCDVAFLDIEMAGKNGVDVAKKIKQYSPKTNIIFTTAYDDYLKEAFDLHASGYILKPANVRKINKEIRNLRFPPKEQDEEKNRGVSINTFGNFEVFYNGQPMELGKREKEMFAYLVDRQGASINNGELYSILFEGEPGHEENFKKIKKSLIDKFDGLDVKGILVKKRGSLAVNPNKVKCDLYDWRKGSGSAINKYQGEYMSQYSWAEFSVGEFGKIG